MDYFEDPKAPLHNTGSIPSIIGGPNDSSGAGKNTFQESYVSQTQNRTIPNICFFVLVSVAIKRAKVSNMIIMDKPLNHWQSKLFEGKKELPTLGTSKNICFSQR